MSDYDNASVEQIHLTERRKPQRDWLGHGVQAMGLLLVIGMPLIFWGISMNNSVALLAAKVDRQERDINEERQVQTLVTGQLLDVNKQLTRIDTQLGDLRDVFKKR